MDDKEKNQKTIIAVVAGLAIGGLLVWVFSSVPSTSTPDEPQDETPETEEMTDDNDDDAMEEDDTAVTPTPSRVATGPGSVAVANQPAGALVVLGATQYPNPTGWIVVREEDKGSGLGSILGASRFDTVAGLLPTQVVLLRNTVKGGTYHVLFHTEDGDNVFNLTTDLQVEKAGGGMMETTFVAQ